ncbi:VacJ family lipoprotein [Candidatus Propionivibrio aalborgensis]|uniref:VacJ family lipoprotein n=1 Tax=Candidatus Propionivibrio aalborgensis TaxID=1860101 RepID=A0A1A8Y1U8_9RHOO|nr:VacJ family lipoprotein [Candidatus Propionivibrio aalborgensis]SBT11095.1 VacJ family lipoprotein [Candidatus Propionivibrio aalborgensis]
MKKLIAKRMCSVAFVTAILGGLTGCATTADNPQDPYEGFNRAMFAVNEGIDVVVKPVAQGYEAAAPLPVKAGIGNFFGNLWDVITALNGLLQGKGEQGLSDIGRVLINTTVGIGGVFDVASEMGLEKHSEDFGQTLGVWGVGEGPYFYWPLIGPRTTRDTFGWMVDSYMDPVWNISDVPVRNSLVGVRYIDLRASLLPTDKIVDQAAFDKYDYIREAYLQNRRSEVNDGHEDKSECKQSRCY